MTQAEREAARYTGYLRNQSYGDFLRGYRKAVKDICEYLQDNIDQDLTIYHKHSWCKRDEFINKLKRAMED